MGEPAIEPAPDPQGVAADILNGEGSSAGPKSSTERVRAYRARQRAGGPEPGPTPEPAPILNPAETAGMVGALWDSALVPIAGRWPDGTRRLRPLTSAQALRLGEVYAPLVNKYLPLVGAWQLEIAALVVTVAVLREATTPAPKRASPAPFADDIGEPNGPVAADAPAS